MPAMPLGTITLLFTDIEGSTKLWEEHTGVMSRALAWHDAMMRQTIESHQGIVFKTIGDAFCAAFATAPDALQAALAIQRVLIAESFEEDVTLRVRMALHTGTVEHRDGDYFGPPLNRVARLLSVAYGGQVLVSMVCQELVRDALPPACTLLNLGEHGLRDLHRAETVFQLQHPDLPAEFPPLKSLANPGMPNNLPQQVTSFIGREQEMEAVKTLLAKTRLLTLTGSGGCGKTRLALQVAADVLEQFPDGVWLVELASLADPALVPQAIAQILGVKEQSGQSVLETLREHLKNKSMLLVMDNCEHLLSACGQLLSALLRACPNLKGLATSREALGIAGELTHRVPPLTSPDLKQTITPESLNQYEAVRLFIERAQFHKPDFRVTSQNAPALAQLCFHLEGIPLAIELAAARVRSLSVEDINTRLDSRFRLLTGGDRSALPRQQTLRALIDWSYDLLGAKEKLLLARLSVFAGGWTLASAEQVCIGEHSQTSSSTAAWAGRAESAEEEMIEDWEVLDLLSSLADKSLVLVEEQAGGGRYRLLESVRQYMAEKLQQSGEETIVRCRHRDAFYDLLGTVWPQGRPDASDWLRRVGVEQDNLRAALDWGIRLQTSDEAETERALQMASYLWFYWQTRALYHEGRDFLQMALARHPLAYQSESQHLIVIVTALLEAACGNFETAYRLLDKRLAWCRDQGDIHGICNACFNYMGVCAMAKDFARIRKLGEEALALTKTEIARRKEADEPADPRLENFVAAIHSNMASALIAEGDLTGAAALFRESIMVQRKYKHMDWLAESLKDLGFLLLRSWVGQDVETAGSLLKEALQLAADLGYVEMVRNCLRGLAQVAGEQIEWAQAARLLGAAEGIRRQSQLASVSDPFAVELEEGAAVRAALGEETFALYFAQGQAATLEQMTTFTPF